MTIDWHPTGLLLPPSDRPVIGHYSGSALPRLVRCLHTPSDSPAWQTDTGDPVAPPDCWAEHDDHMISSVPQPAPTPRRDVVF
jgi:hypothetical protein